MKRGKERLNTKRPQRGLRNFFQTQMEVLKLN